jgi:hypothetical protein
MQENGLANESVLTHESFHADLMEGWSKLSNPTSWVHHHEHSTPWPEGSSKEIHDELFESLLIRYNVTREHLEIILSTLFPNVRVDMKTEKYTHLVQFNSHVLQSHSVPRRFHVKTNQVEKVHLVVRSYNHAVLHMINRHLFTFLENYENRDTSFSEENNITQEYDSLTI